MLVALLLALLSTFSEAQIEPAQLASQLSRSQPLILYVGFPVLYKGAHIHGALLAGPASKAEGLASLASAVKGIAPDRSIVIYCGCCPWDKCPNIHPAYDWLTGHGYSHVQVLHIATNLHTDWVKAGYPTDKPAQ